jgi:predicted AAA+ superfamily ATPase
LSQKKYYFSFEDDIVAKKFKNADDFIGYMQIKYGIDFQDNNLLLLNEIQYSKKLLTIFHELLALDIKTQIIATGIVHTDDEEYKILLKSGQACTITVHPLGLFDFLDAKSIHTNYLTLSKPSPVMFKEIQHLFDEYLVWG